MQVSRRRGPIGGIHRTDVSSVASLTVAFNNRLLIGLLASAAVLSGCGGGGLSDAATPQATGATQVAASDPASETASGTGTGAGTVTAADLVVSPHFHMARAELTPPSDVDIDGNSGSAFTTVAVQMEDAAAAGLDTRRLTIETLQAAKGARALADVRAFAAAPAPQPISTFTPAQIKAAYAMPVLPAGANLAATKFTAAQAAAMGAGQTIYLVDSNDDPNAAAELAAFNAQFGLPGCTTVPMPATTKLPLAAAAATAGCTFSVAYVGASGQLSNAQPAYDGGWASEIALDVQWSHATAPLARIILLEAPSATLSNLTAAIQLANLMGPGVVSMSFGGAEGSYVPAYDGVFTRAGSSYVASTGDSGAGVNWPSVSTNVMAVGGTTLNYTGSGARSEVTWSRTGGGLSAFEVEPAFQAVVAVPGEPVAKVGAKTAPTMYRGVADVALTADPMRGVYVAMIPKGAKAVSWGAFGGTSVGAPQWSGVIAVANAQRAAMSKAALGGAAVAMLYRNIAAVKGIYAGAFYDVSGGGDGTAATAQAGNGYDLPTGLGTPNVGNLLAQYAAY